jgi:biotin transport system substrate-specific component
VQSGLPVPGITYERRARPAPWGAVVRESLFLLAATAFLALTARISVPLPFTPVPISGQTLGVLLVGALYGPRRAALALAAYVAEGAAGLPVFSMGRAGLPVLLGPTGGYIVGFLPAAVLAGALAGAVAPVWRRAAGLVLASLVVYLVGAPWLAAVTGVPLDRALATGVLPFLPGDAIKVALVLGVTPAGAAVLARLGLRPW